MNFDFPSVLIGAGIASIFSWIVQALSYKVKKEIDIDYFSEDSALRLRENVRANFLLIADKFKDEMGNLQSYLQNIMSFRLPIQELEKLAEEVTRLKIAADADARALIDLAGDDREFKNSIWEYVALAEQMHHFSLAWVEGRRAMEIEYPENEKQGGKAYADQMRKQAKRMLGHDVARPASDLIIDDARKQFIANYRKVFFEVDSQPKKGSLPPIIWLREKISVLKVISLRNWKRRHGSSDLSKKLKP